MFFGLARMLRSSCYLLLAYVTHEIASLANYVERNAASIHYERISKQKRSNFGESDLGTEMVCEARGLGTSEFSVCPKRTCRANVDCWVAYGIPQQCVCDPHFCGLVCLPVASHCPSPSKPDNGNVFFRDSKVGAIADYSCLSGFTVMGPRKRHCLASLKWSGQDPVCTNQTDHCFSPPYMPNTMLIEGHRLDNQHSKYRDDYRDGESITMVCHPGFEDSDRKFTTALCVGNQWKYEKIDCQRIFCSNIIGLENGRTLYTSDKRYQATAVQFCNDGYQIKCRDETAKATQGCRRVCLADGSWSSANAECIPVTCPKLQKPENGFISGYLASVGSVAAVECAEGFELRGSAFRKCLPSGQWDGEAASCEVRDCGQPPDIPHAVIQFSSTQFFSKAYFSCDVGAKSSIATAELTCGQVGNHTTWLPYPYPVCYKHCRVPTLENANVSSPTGSSRTADKELIANGKLVEHDTEIVIACLPGYSIVIKQTSKQTADPTASVVCENGKWSRDIECRPSRCTARPPNISNALTRFYSLEHGSVVRYQCYPGYRLDTEHSEVTLRLAASAGNLRSSWPLNHDRYSVKCDYGVWKGELPSCVQIRCSRPSVPEGVEIYLIGARGRWPFGDNHILPTHGAVVEFNCSKEDYRLTGSRYSFCIDGHWSPGETPNCTKITHDLIPQSWLFYKP